MSLQERLEEGWIHCNMIIEILGKPVDYVNKVIGEVKEALGKVKGVEVINSTSHEPKPIEHGLYSTFTEVEIAVKDMGLLLFLIFSYMPSNIEIIAPSEIEMPLSSMNEFVNFLASRLHGYDSLAKRSKMENLILKKKLQELGAIPKQEDQQELDTIKTEEEKKD